MPDLITEAYEGVTLELPNGRRLRAKSLAWRNGARFLALLVQYEDGKQSLEESLLKILEDLSLGEMYDLVRRFLFLRRTAEKNGKTPTPAPAPPTG